MGVAFQLDLAVWEERGEVFKQDFVAAGFGMVAVDAVQPHEGEVFFVVFGDAHRAFYGVARVQVEAAYLLGGNVNVVGTGEIGGGGAA